jgi:phage shock protein PspC (stress-responsive transcriptional regulator)
MLKALQEKSSQWFGSILPLGKLRKRDDGGETLAGVCSGVAYWIGAPEWVARVAMVGLVFLSNWAIVGYIVLAICLPDWEQLPEDYAQRVGAD